MYNTLKLNIINITILTTLNQIINFLKKGIIKAKGYKF